MLEAALAWLAVRPEGTYVDATAGLGGHSEAIARRLTSGRLIALDRDPAAVALAGARLAPWPAARVVEANYGEMAGTLAALGVEAVDGILLDAGCSSMQLDESGRGFSFQADGPLDMRMNPGAGVPASEFLASTPPETLATLLRTYGDVERPRRIAEAISARAAAGRLIRTSDLVAAVREALPFVRDMPEEVRTVFQAVRMAVNDELRWLEAGVLQAVDLLRPGGRLVVISFHSGEDRVVKGVLRAASRSERLLHPDGRTREERPPRLRVLTPKPVPPDAAEMAANPRSKSARLRAAERR
jgi:16S rRNA (cytosine1402-N4)-methyltransferase